MKDKMSYCLSVRHRLLLLTALFAMLTLACEFSFSTANVTNAVMARDVEGANFDPVGITDTYAADQRVLHAVVTIANAPSDTLLKAVWVALDVGSAAAPDATLDETELEVEGTRNVDFTLTPNSGQWLPGKYKVDIYLNGEFNRTLNFSVMGPPEQASVEPTATAEEASATAEPTPTNVVSTPTLEPSPTTPSTANIITDAVMARDITVLTSTPIEVTDIFPPDQAIVHAIVMVSDAPSGTKVKAVWTAIDVGDAAPPNTGLGEYETIVEGSQNVDFTFEPSGTGFPPGTYMVEIYLNDNLDRTLSFTVVEDEAGSPVIPTATVAPVGSCPPLPLPEYEASGFVSSITMAQDTQGTNYEPVNPGQVFQQDSTFHAVVAIENAPANTEVAAIWYVVDVGSAEPCNTAIAGPFTLTTSDSRNIDFTLQPPPGALWPVGFYRVEIYLNGNLDLDVEFSVE